MKQIAFSSFIFFLVLFSCTKSNQPTNESTFYGKWVTTHGDTVQFTRLSNGKYILLYKAFCPGNSSPVEYTIKSNKLALKDDLSNPTEYRAVESFNWLQYNKTFEAKAHDWYTCMSNDLKIVFTKIE